MDYKSILVTGGSGFIASNFVNYMVEKYPNTSFINFDQKGLLQVVNAKRSNNYLDTTKLEKLYPNIKPIKESVKNIMYKIKNNEF